MPSNAPAASEEESRAQKLNALSQSLKSKRQDAIDGRKNLGIEDQWKEDIEFYEGIDDANRAEMTGSLGEFTSKPPGQIGTDPDNDQSAAQGSTVFINITRPYCDAAAARIGDMLMPTDDRAFGIKPTPVPELENMAMGKLSLSMKKGILAQVPTTDPGGQPIPAEQQQAQGMTLVQDSVRRAILVMEEAKERSKKAQDRIDDWHVQCQYHAEVRRVIDDVAKLGTGVLKGPFPNKKKQRKLERDPQTGTLTLVLNENIDPASRRIDPRNLFPDPACGDNIHNGSYIFERDYLTRKQVMDLIGTKGYIDSELAAVLKEGPKWAALELPADDKRDPQSKDLFEVWYFHGMLDVEDFEAMGCHCDPDKPMKAVDVVVTMINERIVKGAMNPLDVGEFPYDVMVWQPVSGKWTGIGVSRQIRTPQRMVNAAGRNMMDNAGLTSGPQILVKLGVISPADGQMSLHGRKIWYVDEDAELTDIKQAFGVFNIDARQKELMEIIYFGLKLAEDVTGLPLLLQGQQGEAPDTLGGMQIINNNASTVLRRLAKLFDDMITEPHVRRYYAWLMQHGEDEAEKGDFQVDARGSSALVERDLQNQAVIQMGQIVTNPAFGVNPRKWFEQYCKSQRLDPKEFQYTEDEQKRIDEAAAQGPTDPRLAVAQLRVQYEDKWKQMDAQLNQQLAAMEQRFEANENAKDRRLEAWIKQMEQNGTKSITFDQLKTKLAETGMKLRTQRDLSAESRRTDMQKHVTPKAATPPTEPNGRAPRGQAFQR